MFGIDQWAYVFKTHDTGTYWAYTPIVISDIETMTHPRLLKKKPSINEESKAGKVFQQVLCKSDSGTWIKPTYCKKLKWIPGDCIQFHKGTIEQFTAVGKFNLQMFYTRSLIMQNKMKDPPYILRNIKDIIFFPLDTEERKLPPYKLVKNSHRQFKKTCVKIFHGTEKQTYIYSIDAPSKYFPLIESLNNQTNIQHDDKQEPNLAISQDIEQKPPSPTFPPKIQIPH